MAINSDQQHVSCAHKKSRLAPAFFMLLGCLILIENLDQGMVRGGLWNKDTWQVTFSQAALAQKPGDRDAMTGFRILQED